MALETISFKCGDHLKIYTDGSVTEDGVGIGIYNATTNEKININIKQKVAIKTAESVAILYAMLIARRSGRPRVVILTDSKSSCSSIDNTNNNLLDRYYKNKIIN